MSINQRFSLIAVLLLLSACSMKKQSDEEAAKLTSDTVVLETEDKYHLKNSRQFIDYPIPHLDSILPFVETSGAHSKAPSEQFYNPADSGIFVFYTLFEPRKSSINEIRKQQNYIGELMTHTYYKSAYGWAETDKDQTFISLKAIGGDIKVNDAVKIGASLNEVLKVLGNPISQSDSSFIFLGKNKVIGHFDVEKGKVRSFVYGRFNLHDSIFEKDSASIMKVLKDKLEESKR